MLVGPRVLLDDRELELSSVGVLGDPAHGVFHVGEQTAGVQELIVARLDQLLSRELRQLVVDPHSLLIPPDDEARFLTDFIPRLRQKMTITSADRSVRLPDYIEPTVGLVVHFRPEHRVRLDWMVQYDGPESSTTYAIDDPPEPRSIRDLAEEQRKLAALPLPYADIPQLANRSKELPQQPAAHVLLDGMAALQFVEQVLPQLAACRGAGHAGRGNTRVSQDQLSANRSGGGRRACRLGRLVRPAHQGRDRRRGGSLRGSVRRADPGPGLFDLGDRGLLLLGATRIRPTASSDRGVQGSAGSAPP